MVLRKVYRRLYIRAHLPVKEMKMHATGGKMDAIAAGSRALYTDAR
jgi:hypothetical protein